MKTMADDDDARGVRACLLDGFRHGLRAGEMAERMTCVEYNGAVLLRYNGRLLMSRYRTSTQPLDIHVDQHHAVRGQPFKIRVHQPLSDGCRCSFGDACGHE